MTKAITYKKAGVNIDVADIFINKIKPLVAATSSPSVIGGIGGFGAFFKPDMRGMKEPILVSATDGVGTKLLAAEIAGKHDTVGIDLVAMSVNDIVATGARPLFFLDYFSTGKLDPKQAVSVVKGIVAGCKRSGCALIGGETAEMPGLYKGKTYDLAGFCVGIVDRAKIINGSAIKRGDRLIGLASSGIHSNGYSYVRFRRSNSSAETSVSVRNCG